MDVSEVLHSTNERIAEINRSFDLGGLADARHEYVCECVDLRCFQLLELSPAEYRAVRAHRSRFLVAADHVDENVDRVIARAAAAVVVERVAPEPADRPRLEASP